MRRYRIFPFNKADQSYMNDPTTRSDLTFHSSICEDSVKLYYKRERTMTECALRIFMHMDHESLQFGHLYFFESELKHTLAQARKKFQVDISDGLIYHPSLAHHIKQKYANSAAKANFTEGFGILDYILIFQVAIRGEGAFHLRDDKGNELGTLIDGLHLHTALDDPNEQKIQTIVQTKSANSSDLLCRLYYDEIDETPYS